MATLTTFRTVNNRPLPTSPGSSPKIELKVTSDPANLAAVRKAIEGLCASDGFDEKTCAEVGLCVNEAVANVIRHAYDGKIDQPVEIVAELGEELTVKIRDWGNGVDPSTLPCRIYNPLEPGGVGLICLHQWMDDIAYTPQADGMLLTMRRRKRAG